MSKKVAHSVPLADKKKEQPARGKVQSKQPVRAGGTRNAEFAYVAGQIEMFETYKFENLFGPLPARKRVKRLKELFVISSDLNGRDWLLRLDIPLRERYQFLTQNRHRRKADLVAAESLASSLLKIVETDLFLPFEYIDLVPPEDRPSLENVYELCGAVKGALKPYLQPADSNGKINNRNALSRLARVFSNVCAIYGGVPVVHEPHGKAWTCKYRDLETGLERKVPIAVAAIEGAFILTRKSWQLPKKKLLWEWMQENVLAGRKAGDVMKAQILETAMLSALEEDHCW